MNTQKNMQQNLLFLKSIQNQTRWKYCKIHILWSIWFHRNHAIALFQMISLSLPLLLLHHSQLSLARLSASINEQYYPEKSLYYCSIHFYTFFFQCVYTFLFELENVIVEWKKMRSNYTLFRTWAKKTSLADWKYVIFIGVVVPLFSLLSILSVIDWVAGEEEKIIKKIPSPSLCTRKYHISNENILPQKPSSCKRNRWRIVTFAQITFTCNSAYWLP